MILIFFDKLRKAFKEIKQILEGKDGRLSGKRIIGTLFALFFIKVVDFAVKNDKVIQPEVLMALVSLICVFWGLTMVPDILTKIGAAFNKKMDQNSNNDGTTNGL